MSKTYKDIFNLNIKYVEYLLEKSLFSHQYIKNISISGGFVENEIREIFRNILPKRFHVTHGYIISAPDRSTEPTVSPQIDMIIVDTLVPHSLFIVDKENGMEIVPKEAVVAVFEIKRKLNKYSLMGTKKYKGALEHLDEIISKTQLTKYNEERFLAGGIKMGNGLKGGYYNNPLIGILTLEHEKSLLAELPPMVRGNAHSKTLNGIWIQSIHKPEIDIMASLDGLLYSIVDDNPPHNLLIANVREKGKTYKYAHLKKEKGRSQAFIVSRIFGYFLSYLQNLSGKNSTLENYFFNKSII